MSDNNNLEKRLSNLSPLIRGKMLPLLPYLNMENISEIVINEEKVVYIEHLKKGWERIEDEKLTIDFLNKLGEYLATNSGQVFNATQPMLATELPAYGYRVQLIGSMSNSGIAMCIRVGTSKLFPLNSYMPEKDVERVLKAITDHKTILVVGGTSTGKTSMLNNLISHLDPSERPVVIEDTKELIVPNENCLRLIKSKTGTDSAQITYDNIIDSVLRMRPDRIIMGELTLDNTLPFLKLINTGHAGAFSTIHANGAEEAFEALALNMAINNSGAGDMQSISKFARSSIDCVLHLKRESRQKITATFHEF